MDALIKEYPTATKERQWDIAFLLGQLIQSEEYQNRVSKINNLKKHIDQLKDAKVKQYEKMMKLDADIQRLEELYNQEGLNMRMKIQSLGEQFLRSTKR